ncbi:hypothetical protein SNEBB_001333 [Seison nebaliae]|nr:hypothetical protein SNEBB_001333 [Seison nebaliae]
MIKTRLLFKQMNLFNVLPPIRLDADENYEKCEKLLNRICRRQDTSKWPDKTERLLEIKKNLKILNINDGELKDLRVIHVAGTKGKGSTCAIIESILRNDYKLKTGLFTSPHLIDFSERIKINGEVVESTKFSQAVNKLYDELKMSEKLLHFFDFLTITAFYLFHKEKVDVTILEVGIGGRYDSTNIIQQPIVCGITFLDLDHCEILGDTIEEIAYEKGGIMKKNIPTFTISQQQKAALNELKECSKNQLSKLNIIPTDMMNMLNNNFLSNYSFAKPEQLENIILATYIVDYFIKSRNSVNYQFNSSRSHTLNLLMRYRESINQTIWLGRYQSIDLNNYQLKNETYQKLLKQLTVKLFLDSAHTLISMKICSNWFFRHLNEMKEKENMFNCLIIYSTKKRLINEQIKVLDPKHQFHYVFVTPTSALSTKDRTQDVFNEIQKYYSNVKKTNVVLSSDINSTFQSIFLHSPELFNIKQLNLLVTGSVILVGDTLKYIRNSISDNSTT